MSFIYSLFIFFLCFSMYACSARHFGVVNKDSIGTQLHFNSQDKVKALDLNSIEGGTSKGSEILDKGNYQGSAITRAESMKGLTAILSGHLSIKPLVSVSWRVPVKQHAGKSPGIFSDYSQPRTRTPSHN